MAVIVMSSAFIVGCAGATRSTQARHEGGTEGGTSLDVRAIVGVSIKDKRYLSGILLIVRGTNSPTVFGAPMGHSISHEDLLDEIRIRVRRQTANEAIPIYLIPRPEVTVGDLQRALAAFERAARESGFGFQRFIVYLIIDWEQPLPANQPH